MNMDLVVKTSRRPSVGETIIGDTFFTKPGGKGANQAVAAARLGAEVYMIGLVGDDIFGKDIVSSLEKEGIILSNMEPVPHTTTGIASITLSEGDNNIIIVPGANAHVTPEYLHQHIDILRKSNVVIAQLEIPLETINELSKLCKQLDKKFILNPAPSQKLTDQIIENSMYLTPNQIELEQLAQHHPQLLKDYQHKLIVTDGENGSYFFKDQTIQRVSGFKATPFDTTGAGDCFNGALAYSLATNKSLIDACTFANAAASLAVQKVGAQDGMPTKAEVEKVLSI